MELHWGLMIRNFPKICSENRILIFQIILAFYEAIERFRKLSL